MLRLRLNQTAVYWQLIGNDDFGRPKFAAPVQLPCRWEDYLSETINSQGDKVLSSATIYLASPVAVGGVLMQGLLITAQASGFPPNIKDSPLTHEILSVLTIPALKGSQTLTTAKVV